jgi:hypothetical protein
MLRGIGADTIDTEITDSPAFNIAEIEAMN